MNMVKIEITEKNGKRGHAISEKGVPYYEGDQVTVTEYLAKKFCGNGWARDLSGKIETGERDTTPKFIQPVPRA